MRILNAFTATAAALLCAVVAAAGTASAADSEVWLQGAGATFPAPLYKKWIAVHHEKNPAVSISYDSVGSGEGISRFVTGSVDFGASDAPLSEAEAKRVAGGVVTVPGTAGMIVIAYNIPGFSGDLKLPRDVYADIFAGNITRWDDPRIQAANPQLTMPRRNIALVTRLDSSGTTYAFSSHLAAISDAWRQPNLKAGKLVNWPASAMLVRGNEGVSSRIKISENSIGYVEYGFAKRLGLPVAALQNKAGAFVRPSGAAGQQALAEATASGKDDLKLSAILDPAGAQSYPIVTYSWLLLYGEYKDARNGAALTKSLSWGLNEGQARGEDMGYIPVPREVAARGQEALAGIRY